MDASLHLSAVKPLGALPGHPNVPVGLSNFHGPLGQSPAIPGTASADLIISSQPLTWQAESEAANSRRVPLEGFKVMVHGLQTKPMGAQPVSAQSAAQVQP